MVTEFKGRIKGSGLDDGKRNQLQNIIQAYFREWLHSSAHIRHVSGVCVWGGGGGYSWGLAGLKWDEWHFGVMVGKRGNQASSCGKVEMCSFGVVAQQ